VSKSPHDKKEYDTPEKISEAGNTGLRRASSRLQGWQRETEKKECLELKKNNTV